jgi:hypothetical protein
MMGILRFKICQFYYINGSRGEGKSMNRLISTLILMCAAALAAPQVSIAADVPLDSPLYPILDRLWSEGKIEGYRPDTLPISRSEARDLISQVDDDQNLLLLLGTAEPRYSIRLGWEAGDEGFVPRNRAGIPVSDGPVANLGFGMDLPPFTLYADGRFPIDADQDTVFTEAYATWSFGTFRLTAGKEDMWWGASRRGSLILTDNAEALTMVRLENYPGFDLPWFLRYLGETRLNFFLSRLDDDRGAFVPEPLMGGLKVHFTPHRNLVLSLNRTFLFGGEGREEDLAAFLDVLFGRSGDESASAGANVIGNQIGGLSFVWRIPSAVQPVTLYGEIAGEDEANGLPSKTASLGGVYLPRIAGFRTLDFRFEAADNTKYPTVWYVHPDYPYTHEGRIMGHPMGTGAEDYYAELGVYPSSNSRLSLASAYTRKLRSPSSSDYDNLWTYGVRGSYWTQGVSLDLEWTVEDWKGLPSGEKEGFLLDLGIRVHL